MENKNARTSHRKTIHYQVLFVLFFYIILIMKIVERS